MTCASGRPQNAQLIVIAYDDQHKAEEARLKFLRLQKDYLIDLEDAVVAVRKPDGKIRLNQSANLTANGAIQGTFWGVLIGILLCNPLLGGAIGAGAGALVGALSDVGIDDQFMRELAEALSPGSSALFVLVRVAAQDKVLEALSGAGGKVLKTSLTHADEERLQAALQGRELASA